MIYNIPQPVISHAFTIEDIHRIRKWHYEQLKNATLEEQLAFYNEGSKEIFELINEYRKKKQD